MSIPLLTETRERFLIAIVARIPAERIAEIHFFAPIKQGGVESGVAVVVEQGAVTDAAGEDGAAATEAEEAVAAPDVEASLGLEDSSGEEPNAESAEPELAEPESSEPESSEPAREADAVTPPAPRYVVHTARYRLTLKGIDRGKWETHVFAEADAPLATVDAVVRGVQRRAGDVDDVTRMDGDEVRAFMASRAAA